MGQIEQRIKNGNRSIVYTESEIHNIFTLYDLKGAGSITKPSKHGELANAETK